MSIFICIITIFVLLQYNKSSGNLSEATPRIARFDTRKMVGMQLTRCLVLHWYLVT